MKAIDKFLRSWRTRIALKAVPKSMGSVLDIGCGDEGYLLRRMSAAKRDGIDPTLAGEHREPGLHLANGFFPGDLPRLGLTGPYDAIFALAVFEHLTAHDMEAARAALPGLLRPGGRLIITVPHPFVDRILDILMFFRLIDGQAVEEHHGFDPADLARLTSDHIRLVARRSFQLGLNNLFVFQRIGDRCN
jgi:SAM-dependent methyltransferase